MYRKILVPLDGSELAECVFPHVEAIANGCRVPEVIFVRVIEPFRISAGDYALTDEQTRQIEADRRSVARDYLDRIKGRVKLPATSMKTVLLKGIVADGVAEYASKEGVDLIVIATHGRSGVRRWVWGSVADRLLRSSCVPVLMVRAPGCVPEI